MKLAENNQTKSLHTAPLKLNKYSALVSLTFPMLCNLRPWAPNMKSTCFLYFVFFVLFLAIVLVIVRIFLRYVITVKYQKKASNYLLDLANIETVHSNLALSFSPCFHLGCLENTTNHPEIPASAIPTRSNLSIATIFWHLVGSR